MIRSIPFLIYYLLDIEMQLFGYKQVFTAVLKGFMLTYYICDNAAVALNAVIEIAKWGEKVAVTGKRKGGYISSPQTVTIGVSFWCNIE